MPSNDDLTRRDFASTAAGALSILGALGATSLAAQTGATASGDAPIDLVEWSFFWVGVEKAEIPRGTVINGKQMYVEYQIPRRIKHPYPIVLVHGGGGQGTDWMCTPDGRPGWATLLVQEGYKVYVVDRPGHGRSPFHPDLDGPFPQQNITLDQISGMFTPQRAKRPDPTGQGLAKLHNQWPGTGEVGSPELAQLVASQGGSYVSNIEITHTAWRERGAELLDKIGPAIIMTHSAGGPFGYLVAEVRPTLVKGIVVVEGAGTPFGKGPQASKWGITTIPMTYDPRVTDPSELKTKEMPSPEPGVGPYQIQEGPAHKLKNLRGIPIVLVTSEASFASPGAPGALAFLKQAGCTAEELRLAEHGVHGNGHMMMVEKNNREVLQPILDWMDQNVSPRAKPAPPRKNPDAIALKLSEQGHFWVGTEAKQMPYGSIVAGQMYVQYLFPAEVRHPYPIVLVHGGGGQGTHYMGLGNGKPGWVHYYLQEGYKVYLVDRQGHGRAPYHPDALGPIGPLLTFETVTGDFMRAVHNAHPRWIGTGDARDPLVDHFQAGQNSPPADNVMAHKLWASRGRRDARQNRAGDHSGSFGGRPVQLAGGERAAEPGEGHRQRGRRGYAVRLRRGLGIDGHSAGLRSAGGRSEGNCHARRCGVRDHARLQAAGRARAQAEKLAGYSDRDGDRRVIRPHPRPSRCCVSEGSRLRRRRASTEGQGHPRQRALHDAGDQQPASVRRDSGVGGGEASGVSSGAFTAALPRDESLRQSTSAIESDNRAT